MNQIECYKCPVCGWEPSEKTAGGSWDHCPNCLSGTHGPCGGILEPIGVYRPEVDDSQSAVQAWIAGLDLEV